MSRCLQQLSCDSKAPVASVQLQSTGPANPANPPELCCVHHGRKAKFQPEVNESKEVLYSLQVGAPEVNGMDLQEDSALCSPWKTFERELLWMSGKIEGEFGPWNRTPGAWATVSLGQNCIGFRVHTVPPTLPGCNIGAKR